MKKNYFLRISLYIMALILAICLGISAIGCGSGPVEPVYTSNEKFDIGMWVGINQTVTTYDETGTATGTRNLSEEEFDLKYKEIAEAGINIAFPGSFWVGNFTSNNKALKYAEKYGIRHIILDTDIKDFLLSAYYKAHDGYPRTTLIDELNELVAPYKQSEHVNALYGFFFTDEPSSNRFDMLAFAQDIFNEVWPEKILYVNLFPVIATGTQTGTNYAGYIGNYLNKFNNDYLSYDHYPLFGDGFKTWTEDTFLYNMLFIKKQLMDEVAFEERETERSLWTFLQSVSYSPNHRSILSQADISFQANSFLAFGGDCIQWFTYCTPENGGTETFGPAMLDRNLEKTDTYYYVQKANSDIQFLMPWYKNFEWQGVMISDVSFEDGFGYIKEDEYVISDHDVLKEFKSTEDAFCGVFSDKDGKSGFMFVNYTDPGKNIENKLELKFEKCTHAVVVKNGAKEIIKLSGGKTSLNLSSGEGAFVIPY